MRHVVDERVARRRQQAVADEDLLDRGFDAHRGEVAELLDARGAEELVLVAQHLGSIDVHDGAGRSIDVPEVTRLGIDAKDVDGVTGTPDHPRTVAALQDLRRPVEAARCGDERAREVRLEVVGRNRRNRAIGERAHSHGRLDDEGIAARDRQLRLAADEAQLDDVARIDEVRIADLVAVHPPKVGPAPGLLQILAGDAPQRIALLHRVGLGRTIDELQVLGLRGSDRQERGGADAQRHGKLLKHKASFLRARNDHDRCGTLFTAARHGVETMPAKPRAARAMPKPPVLAIVLNRHKIST